MEENIVISHDEGFTLTKFFDLLKRSAKRILVYAIIATILGAAVGAVIAVATKGTVEYKGVLEFNYKGIDDGLDPKGNILDTSRIKSNTVINNALTAMGFDANQSANLLPIMLENTIIEGYIPDDMRLALLEDKTISYYPARYIITINSNKDTGFSKSQYIDFLNKLMEEYISYFSDYYDFGKFAALAVKEDTVSASSDYIYALRAYQNDIANLQAEINGLPNTYNLIRNKLQARLDILVSQASELYTYILQNNVQKVGVSMTLEQYLDEEDTLFTAQKTAHNEKAAALAAVIKEYQAIYEQIINNNNTLSVTVTDVTKYNQLITDYQTACEQEVMYKNKIAENTKAKNLLREEAVSTATQRQAVEAKFNVLYDILNKEIGAINSELTDFSKLNVLNNGVKIAMNAAIQKNVSYIASIVAFSVILIGGIAAAIIVTAVKTKKRQDEVQEIAATEAK